MVVGRRQRPCHYPDDNRRRTSPEGVHGRDAPDGRSAALPFRGLGAGGLHLGAESPERALGHEVREASRRRSLIMTLPTHPLGRSGLHISRLGFGSWAVGGGGWSFGWGPQDDADSLATIRHALELGINWIDTAAVYGLGHSEEVVGRLLRELPPAERPLVFTKCGLVWDPRDPMTPPRRVLEPDSIRRECEASL